MQRNAPTQGPARWLNRTVRCASLGFGASAHLQTARVLHLSESLPVLIEIVGKEERIDSFLPELDKMFGDGLVTLEKVRIIRYRGTASS